MAEVPIIHASTPERIKRFNEAVANLKLPYEGELMKGYSPVFPYKAEIWFYKMKEECVPEFLKFVKSNTIEVSGTMRPMQNAVNMGTGLLSFMVNLRYAVMRLKMFLKLYKKGNKNPTKSSFRTVNMNPIETGDPSVPGWGYAKVLGVFPDHRNSDGEEEL